MRHAPITFAEQVAARTEAGAGFDLIFCSDMLNLAEFLGLADKRLRDLPAVAYFHENQLTYPVEVERERDYHYAMTNLTTALAADAVWFNSAYHRRSFLDALREFVTRMPDYRPTDAVATIEARSTVRPQGIHPMPPRPKRTPGPLRILWAARWEHDKDPGSFFTALRQLRTEGCEFRLSVIGEQYQQAPDVFRAARNEFDAVIDRWGYLDSRSDYEQALLEADVVVSTAVHEFFGVSVVEAVAAGAYPLLPRRLAYPEIFAGPDSEQFFYNGSIDALVQRLSDLTARLDTAGSVWPDSSSSAAALVERFLWPTLAPELDAELKQIAHR